MMIDWKERIGRWKRLVRRKKSPWGGGQDRGKLIKISLVKHLKKDRKEQENLN